MPVVQFLLEQEQRVRPGQACFDRSPRAAGGYRAGSANPVPSVIRTPRSCNLSPPPHWRVLMPATKSMHRCRHRCNGPRVFLLMATRISAGGRTAERPSRALAVAVTIYDVAKHAGVSPRTVSNVVNDYPFVAQATRKRVQRSINALGYRPNFTARNLRRGRTGSSHWSCPSLASRTFPSWAGRSKR